MVTRGDTDLPYSENMLIVKTVVDDLSFIVDLGAIPLESVPPEVDRASYPTGNWGEHDALQAVVGHTYAVRTVDGNTSQWAAFTVEQPSPSELLRISWIRSTAPERLDVPDACF